MEILSVEAHGQGLGLALKDPPPSNRRNRVPPDCGVPLRTRTGRGSSATTAPASSSVSTICAARSPRWEPASWRRSRCLANPARRVRKLHATDGELPARGPRPPEGVPRAILQLARHEPRARRGDRSRHDVSGLSGARVVVRPGGCSPACSPDQSPAQPRAWRRPRGRRTRPADQPAQAEAALGRAICQPVRGPRLAVPELSRSAGSTRRSLELRAMRRRVRRDPGARGDGRRDDARSVQLPAPGRAPGSHRCPCA